jgi:hypothetical protein
MLVDDAELDDLAGAIVSAGFVRECGLYRRSERDSQHDQAMG